MPNRISIGNILPALWLLFFPLQGCALITAAELGAAAAGGSMAYKNGVLETSYAAPYDRTWDATLRAMERMKLKVVGVQKGAEKGTVESEQADGTKVKTELISSERDITSARIRVGILGDEMASRTIDRYIRAELKL